MEAPESTRKIFDYYYSLDQQAEIKKDYNCNAIVRELKELSKSQKLCLFIGRSYDQVLPEEKGTIWASLDIKFFWHEERDADDSYLEPPKAKRLHLIMDFNTTDLQKIQKLFDLIVVDESVEKFFDHSPFPILGALLKPKATSQLIIEAPSTDVVDSRSSKERVESTIKRNAAFAQYESSLSEEVKKANFVKFAAEHNMHNQAEELEPLYIDFIIHTQFPNLVQEEQVAIKKAAENRDNKAKEIALQCFTNVDLEHGYYPYETRWDFKPGAFFTCTGPIQEQKFFSRLQEFFKEISSHF